jgi:hypothetical protein
MAGPRVVNRTASAITISIGASMIRPAAAATRSTKVLTARARRCSEGGRVVNAIWSTS